MSSPAKTILLMTQDLFFSSQITGIGPRIGAEIRVNGNPESVRQLCEQESITCVVIDLGLPGLNLPEWVAGFAGSPPPLVAYDAHIRTDRLEQARAAGCVEILTRGQVASQLPRVLTQYLRSSSE